MAISDADVGTAGTHECDAPRDERSRELAGLSRTASECQAPLAQCSALVRSLGEYQRESELGEHIHQERVIVEPIECGAQQLLAFGVLELERDASSAATDECECRCGDQVRKRVSTSKGERIVQTDPGSARVTECSLGVTLTDECFTSPLQVRSEAGCRLEVAASGTPGSLPQRCGSGSQ